MFPAGDIPVLFRGWQTRECVGHFVHHNATKATCFLITLPEPLHPALLHNHHTKPHDTVGRPLSKGCVSKAVFSVNPSVEPRPVVLVIYGGQRTPRLVSANQETKDGLLWSFPLRDFHWEPVFHKDVIYHNGQFYVLSHPGYVASFDIGRCFNNDDHSVKTTLVATAPKRDRKSVREWHLSMLDGELVRFELRKACFCPSCFDKSRMI